MDINNNSSILYSANGASSLLMISFRLVSAVFIAIIVNMGITDSLMVLSTLSSFVMLLMTWFCIPNPSMSKGWQSAILLLLLNTLPSVFYYGQYFLMILNVLYVLLQDFCLCLFITVIFHCLFFMW